MSRRRSWPATKSSSGFRLPNLEAGAVSARLNDGPGQTCGERPRRRHPSHTVGGSLPSLFGLRGVRIPTCRTTARSVLRGLQDKHGRLQQRVSHALSRIPHQGHAPRTLVSGRCSGQGLGRRPVRHPATDRFGVLAIACGRGHTRGHARARSYPSRGRKF